MITQAMILFAIKLNLFSIMQHLAITGAIRGTSREKLYQELGLEYLSDRRWCRRLCFFYKIINNQTTSYLKNFISPKINSSLDYELVRYIVHLLPGPNDFNLHFSHIAYLNGIYSIQNFKIMFLYRPSNVHYYILLAQMHHLFILFIILED